MTNEELVRQKHPDAFVIEDWKTGRAAAETSKRGVGSMSEAKIPERWQEEYTLTCYIISQRSADDTAWEDLQQTKALIEELGAAEQRVAELESKSLLKPATAPVLRGEKCICADSGIAKHFKIRSENNPNCPIHGSIEEIKQG